MGREEGRKGGWATVSICASLDSAAMARGREGLPRCGFQNKMINDVFVLSYKRYPLPFSFSSHALKYILFFRTHGIKDAQTMPMLWN